MEITSHSTERNLLLTYSGKKFYDHNNFAFHKMGTSIVTEALSVTANRGHSSNLFFVFVVVITVVIMIVITN